MKKQSILMQLNDIVSLLEGQEGIIQILKDISLSLSEQSDFGAEIGDFVKNEDTLENIADTLKGSEELIVNITDSIEKDLLSYIKDISETIESLDEEGNDINPVDEVGSLMEDFASSDDPFIRKKASALEQLLLTIAASPNSETIKKAEDDEIDKLKKKYKVNKDIYAISEADKKIKEEYIKEIKKNGPKEYRPLESSLSTRYSPNMPGVSLVRITDDVYQCPVTGEIFDYKSGFTTANGNKVPGSSVENQHQYDESDSGSMFLSTREQRLSE
jgi:hypothetical protein